MVFKCCCCEPDPENWTVIRVSGRDHIVRCAKCRQIWHTQAAYANDLPEAPVPPLQWKKLIHTKEYHQGEPPVVGEKGSYLDPDFKSRLLDPDLQKTMSEWLH
jgi:hypothetical protein